MEQNTLSEGTLLWPLLVYGLAVLAIAGGMIVVSHFLGERHRGRETGLPYESGVSSTGSARLRLSAKFYLVAMFFLIFDLEAVYLFSWAVAARQAGWAGYVEMVVFVGVLLAALAYLWGSGALDWGPRPAARKPLPNLESYSRKEVSLQ